MRIRLFFFFVMLAWVSLFAPQFGANVVVAVDRGMSVRAGMQESGPGIVTAYFTAMLALVCGAGWLIVTVLGAV